MKPMFNQKFKLNAKEIHEKAIVIDAHSHPLLQSKIGLVPFDFGIDNPNSQIDFVKMKKGGVDAVFYALPLLRDVKDTNPQQTILDSFPMIQEAVEKYPQLAEIARSIEDLKRIHSEGKRAIFLTIEYFFDFSKNTLDLLEKLRKHGTTSIALMEESLRSENNDNISNFTELSEVGREIITKMNELGLIIDITHLPDHLQIAVINASTQSVIASHSNARGICNHSRNIPDDIIKMISDKGGVIMVTFNPEFISDEYNLTRTKAYEEYKMKEKQLKVEFGDNEEELEKKLDAIWSELEPETVSMEELIDHIDYITNLVGPNHVGIGSDYGGTSPPKGLETAALYPNITAELVKRGYHEEDIFKILGKNLFRIIEKVQSFKNIS